MQRVAVVLLAPAVVHLDSAVAAVPPTAARARPAVHALRARGAVLTRRARALVHVHVAVCASFAVRVPGDARTLVRVDADLGPAHCGVGARRAVLARLAATLVHVHVAVAAVCAAAIAVVDSAVCCHRRDEAVRTPAIRVAAGALAAVRIRRHRSGVGGVTACGVVATRKACALVNVRGALTPAPARHTCA